MTKEERQQRKIISEQESARREIDRTQKELSETEYKQRARFKALEIAQYLKPPSQIINDGLRQMQRVAPDYDIISASEKIYQWLIKVLK